MRTISLQVQPRLLRDFDERVIDVLEKLRNEPFVHDVWRDSGDDDGPYINVQYQTDDAIVLWSKLHTLISDLGLLSGSIVTCTGRRGWSDYLLLHHFDEKVATGKLPRQRDGRGNVA